MTYALRCDARAANTATSSSRRVARRTIVARLFEGLWSRVNRVSCRSKIPTQRRGHNSLSGTPLTHRRSEQQIILVFLLPLCSLFEQTKSKESLEHVVPPFCCILPPSSSFSTLTSQQSNTSLETMELCVQGYDENKFVIEVGEKDTTETMRQKVASATGLCEDSFRMGFGGKEEGEDITELSAGDTVVLTKTTKYQSVEQLRALGETDISEARLRTVKDPEVASLLLQAEVATVIPNYFLAQASFTRLDLSAVSGVTRIKQGFLHGCVSVTTVDLSGLCNVTHIEDGCLSICPSLTSLDVSGFTGVTVIGQSFLKASGVTNLDLSHMTSVTEVGTHFLACCQSLERIDISGWRRITHIEDGWMQYCSALTTADLSGMSNVTKIDACFLHECTSLTTLDISGFGRDTEIQRNFLLNCNALTTVVLPGNIDIQELSQEDRSMLQRTHAPFPVCVRVMYTRFAEQYAGVRVEPFEAARQDVSGDARQCIALKAGQEGEGLMQAQEDDYKKAASEGVVQDKQDLDEQDKQED